MEIADSARKHGISDTSISHAWENAIKLAEFEYDGEERWLFVIGPDSSGNRPAADAAPTILPGDCASRMAAHRLEAQHDSGILAQRARWTQANCTGVVPRILPTKVLIPRASSSIGRAADF